MMDVVAYVGVAFGILPSFLPPHSVYYDFMTCYNAIIKLLAISSFRTPFYMCFGSTGTPRDVIPSTYIDEEFLVVM